MQQKQFFEQSSQLHSPTLRLKKKLKWQSIHCKELEKEE